MSDELVVGSDEPDRLRRRLTQATAAVGGLAIAGASAPFIASLAPSERARAQGAPVDADISRLGAGQLATFEWRGKPVWILRRTPDMLARLDAVRDELSDPASEVASQQPKYARNRRALHAPRLRAELPSGARVPAARLAGGVLLPMPWLEVRPGGAGVQGFPGSHQSGRAALQPPGRRRGGDRLRRVRRGMKYNRLPLGTRGCGRHPRENA